MRTSKDLAQGVLMLWPDRFLAVRLSLVKIRLGSYAVRKAVRQRFKVSLSCWNSTCGGIPTKPLCSEWLLLPS